ncbi:hypothetical protein [Streptomyces albireticuli]|uniref:Peptidase M41 domain-containing protein n=1 Tax=Streptomyces albireticuli TaxID=1940 RepID=A0A2A2D877_9ACTN|nr:hypothetical protein [Streptomyces albireticuli]MCD9144363.1 hypothetical protein [Streptomyces albireticuli]MCD9161994.1 hypothetical protein [Streptomyces albireticuli]MCD9194000.1 hypothetical protein [Streptomyces albireticuli]PAU47512.1 hypothetical protein CK936_18120 [Streptomyces albireticuli]
MTTWYLNSDQSDGQPVFTRYPEPRAWAEGVGLYECLGFEDAVLRRAIAVHEAGHAVLCMAFGIPVVEICVREDLGKTSGEGGAAWVRTGDYWDVSYMRYAAMCAAGERAQDRWMRETGLWTPQRAWAVERTAGSDRDVLAQALRTVCGTELRFGASRPGVQYGTVQAVADSALSHLWDRLLCLAEALDDRGHLSGHAAARDAGLSYVAVPCEESEGVAA